MKKSLIVFPAALLLVSSIYSCKKSSSSTTPTPTPTPTPTSTTTAPTPTVGDVDGALVSLKIDVTTSVAGTNYTITTETGLATFFASPGNNTSFVDGGAVSVNTFSLDKQTNNSYLKTPAAGSLQTSLNFDDGSNWSVGGNGSVPAFTYNHTAAFPTFTGDIPASISRSAGVTETLGSNVTGADSVIVLIAAGSKSVMHTVAGSAASAAFSAADLATLPSVSDNSAIMEVVPYRITLKAQGTKNYAFIKERAVVKNININ